ncbi:hypothetical protein [Celeribacter arenosi]|uniref:Uncharacterized protein n=1 Tax=Celeribacter arenosi TaxID=792649 RepID=A0ABP7KG27_9RHOB
MKAQAIFALCMVGIAAPVCADIQPQSGIWAGSVVYTDDEGCPPRIEQGLAPALTQGDGYEGQRIDFPDPFSPETFAGDFEWTHVGENHWRAAISKEEPSPMGTISVALLHNLYVRAIDHLESTSEYSITFSEGLAAMVGGAGPCILRSTLDHRRTGD